MFDSRIYVGCPMCKMSDIALNAITGIIDMESGKSIINKLEEIVDK
jgi:hypothetical protein